MKVPFLDLDAQYQKIKPEILKTIESVLDSKKFVQGELAENFAKNFLEVHGGEYGVGCSNGTSAITVALRSLDIGRGDEIITVTNTFFATVEAIHEVGAKTVLVDCDPDTYSIDLNQVEKAITDKTKAIIPVHLYGNPADMTRLMEIADKHNLKVIEDCAQAHLATQNGKAVGTFGNAGTFSFYPGKNLGAYGDAGFIITDSSELNLKATMHINHGRTKKYEHEFLAGNYRIDGIQAAILDVKTKYIKEWTEKRREAAKYYDENLSSDFKVIKVDNNAECSYHLYIVEVDNREEVAKALKDEGIATGIHYPVPMHMQPACSEFGYKEGDFPVAEKASARILSLPIYPEITRDMQDHVISTLKKVTQG